jgi:hypothetical protein
MSEAAQPATLPYSHRQVGFATLMGLGAGFLTQLGAAARDLRRHRRHAWISIPLSIGFVCMMALFSTLKVTVDEARVSACFSGGLLTRRIPLGQIAAARVVTVPWRRGWGIRRTPGGWLYNVWGRRAVELELLEGRTFSIGSDQPEALLAAIEEARGLMSSAAA